MSIEQWKATVAAGLCPVCGCSKPEWDERRLFDHIRGHDPGEPQAFFATDEPRASAPPRVKRATPRAPQVPAYRKRLRAELAKNRARYKFVPRKSKKSKRSGGGKSRSVWTVAQAGSPGLGKRR